MFYYILLYSRFLIATGKHSLELEPSSGMDYSVMTTYSN